MGSALIESDYCYLIRSVRKGPPINTKSHFRRPLNLISTFCLNSHIPSHSSGSPPLSKLPYYCGSTSYEYLINSSQVAWQEANGCVLILTPGARPRNHQPAPPRPHACSFFSFPTVPRERERKKETDRRRYYKAPEMSTALIKYTVRTQRRGGRGVEGTGANPYFTELCETNTPTLDAHKSPRRRRRGRERRWWRWRRRHPSRAPAVCRRLPRLQPPSRLLRRRQPPTVCH